jgi:hypothetical protein
MAVVFAVVAVRVDIEFPTRNPLPHPSVEVEVDLAAEPEGGHGFLENRLGNAEVAEGADRHVAADSGKAIEVENSHGNFQPRF